MSALNLPLEKRRLIVLVPESLVHNPGLANTIYQLATREQRQVFYLALVDGDTKMLAATRSVATLKALVSGGQISSGSRVVEASHWMAALREIYRPGDLIVCHAEQQVRTGFLRALPASDFVRARLDAPVYTIAGFYHPARMQMNQWLRKLVYWAGLLLITAAFFVLEVRLDHDIHGMARNVLLAVLLLATLGVGIAWNGVNSQ